MTTLNDGYYTAIDSGNTIPTSAPITGIQYALYQNSTPGSLPQIYQYMNNAWSIVADGTQYFGVKLYSNQIGSTLPLSYVSGTWNPDAITQNVMYNLVVGLIMSTTITNNLGALTYPSAVPGDLVQSSSGQLYVWNGTNWIGFTSTAVPNTKYTFQSQTTSGGLAIYNIPTINQVGQIPILVEVNMPANTWHPDQGAGGLPTTVVLGDYYLQGTILYEGDYQSGTLIWNVIQPNQMNSSSAFNTQTTYTPAIGNPQPQFVSVSTTEYKLLNSQTLLARYYSTLPSTNATYEIAFSNTLGFVQFYGNTWNPIGNNFLIVYPDSQATPDIEYQDVKFTDPVTLIKYKVIKQSNSYLTTGFDICGIQSGTTFAGLTTAPLFTVNELTSDLIPVSYIYNGTSTSTQVIQTAPRFIFRDIRQGKVYIVDQTAGSLLEFKPGDFVNKAIYDKYTDRNFNDGYNGINLLEGNTFVYKMDIPVNAGTGLFSPPISNTAIYVSGYVNDVPDTPNTGIGFVTAPIGGQYYVYNINLRENFQTAVAIFEIWTGGIKNTYVYILEYTPFKATAKAAYAVLTDPFVASETVSDPVPINGPWTPSNGGGLVINPMGSFTASNGSYKFSGTFNYTMNAAVGSVDNVPFLELLATPSTGTPSALTVASIPAINTNLSTNSISTLLTTGMLTFDFIFQTTVETIYTLNIVFNGWSGTLTFTSAVINYLQV